jgi:hypothetical protein
VRATVPSFCNSATHRGTRRSERKSRRTSARSTSSRRLDVASACVVHLRIAPESALLKCPQMLFTYL